MKQIKLRFEQDPDLSYIDVLIRAADRDGEVEAFMEKLSDWDQRRLMVVREDGAMCMLDPMDIIFASVSGNRIGIVTDNGTYSARQSLQSLEDALDSRVFVRISRYELVNLNRVQAFDFSIRGTLRLELSNGMETWVSRRCIPAVRRRLNGKE